MYDVRTNTIIYLVSSQQTTSQVLHLCKLSPLRATTKTSFLPLLGLLVWRAVGTEPTAVARLTHFRNGDWRSSTGRVSLFFLLVTLWSWSVRFKDGEGRPSSSPRSLIRAEPEYGSGGAAVVFGFGFDWGFWATEVLVVDWEGTDAEWLYARGDVV